MIPQTALSLPLACTKCGGTLEFGWTMILPHSFRLAADGVSLEGHEREVLCCLCRPFVAPLQLDDGRTLKDLLADTPLIVDAK